MVLPRVASHVAGTVRLPSLCTGRLSLSPTQPWDLVTRKKRHSTRWAAETDSLIRDLGNLAMLTHMADHHRGFWWGMFCGFWFGLAGGARLANWLEKRERTITKQRFEERIGGMSESEKQQRLQQLKEQLAKAVGEKP